MSRLMDGVEMNSGIWEFERSTEYGN